MLPLLLSKSRNHGRVCLLRRAREVAHPGSSPRVWMPRKGAVVWLISLPKGADMAHGRIW